MTLTTSIQIRIDSGYRWYYTVEDVNVETSLNGCTITYGEDDEIIKNITCSREEALAIADAIYRVFDPYKKKQSTPRQSEEVAEQILSLYQKSAFYPNA